MQIAPGLTLNKERFFANVGHVPHDAQWLFHKSKARFRIPVAGRRFGKSQMVALDRLVNLFQPNTLGWIVGPTYDLADKEFRVMWDELIVKAGLGKEKKVKKAYNKKQGDMYIEMPWGARVECKSEQHPEYLVGDKLDWMILSEAAKQKYSTWDRYLRPALADKHGTADFPTTPEGMNWLYSLWLLGQNPEFPEYDSWRLPSWLNTYIFPGGRQDPEILQMEKSMDPQDFMQEICALFTAFKGKIYPDFNEETHVTNVEFNPKLPNYIAWDWGFSQALVAVEFQVTPSEDIYVWREHVWQYTTLDDAILDLKNPDGCGCNASCGEKPEGYRLDLAFGDAADPEASETVSRKLVPCVSDPRAKENWREGVMLVRKYIKLREVTDDDFGAPIEVPKYFVDYGCTTHIYEMLNYKAKESAQDPVESSTRGAAVKKDDHTCDAMRYALMHLFVIGVQQGLREVGNVTTQQRYTGISSSFSGIRFDSEPIKVGTKW